MSKHRHVKDSSCLQDSQNIFSQVQEASASQSQISQLNQNLQGQNLRGFNVVGNQSEVDQQRQNMIYID